MSHGSYYELDPGMFLITAYFISSFSTSPSSNLILRYLFNCSAPAFLIVDLMHFKGFPSMFILTS